MAHENLRIGIIGGGTMAEAIVRGLLSHGGLPAAQLCVSDHKVARCEELARLYGIRTFVGAEGFLSHIDVLVLAVKPQAANRAMQETAGTLQQTACVLSVAAGLSIAQIESYYPAHPVIRVMPNTPLSVGAGNTAVAFGTQSGAPERALSARVCGAAGRTVEVHEQELDAVTGLSGSGPAYAFLVIEALADGGVAAGLRRETATLLAAQTMLGAAQMVLTAEKSPADLRAAVTSPGGTTAAGLRELERTSTRFSFMEAVLMAAERSKELGRN